MVCINDGDDIGDDPMVKKVREGALHQKFIFILN